MTNSKMGLGVGRTPQGPANLPVQVIHSVLWLQVEQFRVEILNPVRNVNLILLVQRINELKLPHPSLDQGFMRPILMNWNVFGPF